MRARTSEGQRAALRPFSMVLWTVLVTLGAALGLALPVAAFVAASRLDLPAWIVYPSMAIAGALLGLVVGMAQAFSLHRTVITVPRAGWSLITMAGALVAWALGMLPPTLAAVGAALDLTDRTVVGAIVAGAAVILFVVPVAQWLLLRRVVAGAWLWIVVEAVALVVGVGAIWAISRVIDTTRPLADLGPQLGLTGGAVALAFALVTGLGLMMMATRPEGR